MPTREARMSGERKARGCRPRSRSTTRREAKAKPSRLPVARKKGRHGNANFEEVATVGARPDRLINLAIRSARDEDKVDHALRMRRCSFHPERLIGLRFCEDQDVSARPFDRHRHGRGVVRVILSNREGVMVQTPATLVEWQNRAGRSFRVSSNAVHTSSKSACCSHLSR